MALFCAAGYTEHAVSVNVRSEPWLLAYSTKSRNDAASVIWATAVMCTFSQLPVLQSSRQLVFVLICVCGLGVLAAGARAGLPRGAIAPARQGTRYLVFAAVLATMLTYSLLSRSAWRWVEGSLSRRHARSAHTLRSNHAWGAARLVLHTILGLALLLLYLPIRVRHTCIELSRVLEFAMIIKVIVLIRMFSAFRREGGVIPERHVPHGWDLLALSAALLLTAAIPSTTGNVQMSERVVQTLGRAYDFTTCPARMSEINGVGAVLSFAMLMFASYMQGVCVALRASTRVHQTTMICLWMSLYCAIGMLLVPQSGALAMMAAVTIGPAVGMMRTNQVLAALRMVRKIRSTPRAPYVATGAVPPPSSPAAPAQRTPAAPAIRGAMTPRSDGDEGNGDEGNAGGDNGGGGNGMGSQSPGWGISAITCFAIAISCYTAPLVFYEGRSAASITAATLMWCQHSVTPMMAALGVVCLKTTMHSPKAAVSRRWWPLPVLVSISAPCVLVLAPCVLVLPTSMGIPIAGISTCILATTFFTRVTDLGARKEESHGVSAEGLPWTQSPTASENLLRAQVRVGNEGVVYTSTCNIYHSRCALD